MSCYCYSGNPELLSGMLSFKKSADLSNKLKNGSWSNLMASKTAAEFGTALMEVFRSLTQILLVAFNDVFVCISGVSKKAGCPEWYFEAF